MKKDKNSSKSKWDDNWADRQTTCIDGAIPYVAEIIQDWIRVIEGKKILEAGCGAGLDSAQLALWGADTHLMDLSPGAVELSSENYELNKANGAFYVGDLQNLPFADRSFDIVFNRGVVEHFLDPVSVLREMARVSSTWVIVFVPFRFSAYTLNKRFKQLFSNWAFPWETEYSLDELKEICKKAGLEVLGHRGVAYGNDLNSVWKALRGKSSMVLQDIREFMEENLHGVVEIGIIAHRTNTLPNRNTSVPSDLYDNDYYHVCEGFSNPKSRRISRVEELMDIRAGQKMLDIGCGRGEHLAFAMGKGASVVGMDFSFQSLSLSKDRLGSNAGLVAANALSLPFKDDSFDFIIMIDIVEHLLDKELDHMFSEVRRVLKQNGSALIHTAPNRLFIEKGHDFLRGLSMLMYGKYIKKYPRTVYLEMVHVNEQTPDSLKHMLEPYFHADVFVEQGATGCGGDEQFQSMIETLCGIPVLKNYFCVDIFARCRPIK